MGTYRTYGISFLLIAMLQSATFLSMNIVAPAYAKFAIFALAASGFAVWEDRASFLSLSLPIAVVDAPAPRALDLLMCIALGAAIILAFQLRSRASPMRYIAIAVMLLFMASAIQLLLMGRPSYEPGEFSSIWLRTSLLTWALLPAMLGAASLLFPFNVRERAGLFFLVLGSDLVFSIARYVVVLGALAVLGPVCLPLAFIFAGPLLDAILYVSLFSWSLVSLSRRLGRSPELWR